MSVLSNTGIRAGASAAGGDPPYVEDVFSTDSWVGVPGGSVTITNNIDISGEGGMVWLKNRESGSAFLMYDTIRGAGNAVRSDDTDQEAAATDGPQSFTSTGWTTGSSPASKHIGWTFRKQKGFFDVVKYTGTGSTHTESHNLGCVPGCIMIKATDVTASWRVYQKSIGNDNELKLDTDAAPSGSSAWNDTTPTSTQFTVANDDVNTNGKTYIAYLFADGNDSDAQIFGDDEDESIIKMGTFSTDASQNATVTGLGWEPQWVMFKRTSTTGDWRMHDSMRNMAHNGYALLRANEILAEASHATVTVISATPDGFEIQNTNSNSTYAYIAIRRGPMKTPTDATEVFNLGTGLNAAANGKAFATTFPVDLKISRQYDTQNNNYWMSRLTNSGVIYSDLLNAESTTGYQDQWDHPDGIYTTGEANWTSWLNYQFRRAPGFFDIVTWSGDGSQPQVVPHNLGVPPELIIAKDRANQSHMPCFHKALGTSRHVKMNSNAAGTTIDNQYWYGADMATSMNSTHFNTHTAFSHATCRNIAFLFATLDGISKVDSYTGTGNTINVNCGFSAAARFVLIRRWDDAGGGVGGDWYVFDSVRGIVAGGDAFLHFNNDDDIGDDYSNDYIDPLSSGFTITSSAPDALNEDGGTYIYLAIA